MLNRRKMLSSLSSIPFIGWIFGSKTQSTIEAGETQQPILKVIDKNGVMCEITLSPNSSIISYTKEEATEYKIRNGKLYRKMTNTMTNELKVVSRPDRSNRNSSFYQGER